MLDYSNCKRTLHLGASLGAAGESLSASDRVSIQYNVLEEKGGPNISNIYLNASGKYLAQYVCQAIHHPLVLLSRNIRRRNYSQCDIAIGGGRYRPRHYRQEQTICAERITLAHFSEQCDDLLSRLKFARICEHLRRYPRIWRRVCRIHRKGYFH